MLNLTDPALKQLEEHFEGKERQTIRIYLSSGG